MIDMDRQTQAAEIFKILAKNNLVPNTELSHISDFELLVAVVLSAQSTDVQVNKITNVLYKVANTPEQILKLGLERLTQYVKSINYYNNKAKNIIALSQILIDKFNSRVPERFEDLISLPGVGRKTANVVMNVLFGSHTIAVDTHVFRLSNRLGIAQGRTPVEVETNLLKIVPKKYVLNAHHWLILHGRYVCKARKPDCENCSINMYCDYNSLLKDSQT